MIFLCDIKDDLAPYAGDNGICPDDEKLCDYINQARQLLWNRGDWKGLVEYGCLTVEDCCAALPWHLQQIRKAWIGKYPIEVRNQWYEGLSFSGLQSCCDSCCDSQVVDTGVTSPIAKAWPKGYLIEVDPIQMEEGEIEFYVKDRMGVRSTVTIDMANPKRSEDPVYDILGAKKPETNGPVNIYAAKGSERILMAMYHPDQTSPSFTIYKVTNEPCHQILIKAKKRFYKVCKDNDPMGIENVIALQLAMQAKAAQRRNDLEGYASFLAAAEENLEEDIEEMHTNPFQPLDIVIEGAVSNLKNRIYN